MFSKVHHLDEVTSTVDELSDALVMLTINVSSK